jgi:excisionase family DNA binding protein
MIVLGDEEYLTGEEAARRLGVKRATLYAYVSRGLLKSYRQGIKRQRLYRRADVEDLLRLSPGAAPEPAVAEPAALGPAEAEPVIVWRIPAAESWIRD